MKNIRLVSYRLFTKEPDSFFDTLEEAFSMAQAMVDWNEAYPAEIRIGEKKVWDHKVKNVFEGAKEFGHYVE